MISTDFEGYGDVRTWLYMNIRRLSDSDAALLYKLTYDMLRGKSPRIALVMD